MEKVQRRKRKKQNPLKVTRKAEVPCPPPTSIRRAYRKGVLYLLRGLAYDLEGVGAIARQKEKRKRFDQGRPA
jgi:hypothetical protein